METIYDFITKEINRYQKSVTIEDGWDWSMKNHLRRSFLYLNSQFEDNNDDRDLRPNKNIVLGIINVALRTEGFDVKDIELYVDNPDEYYKTPITSKFHDKYARENALDTFIDDLVFSYTAYGGVLVRDSNEKKPEVVNLRTLAFANQTNILDYPFCIKHVMSQAQLRKMKMWGQAEYGATMDTEDLITLTKKEDKDEIEIFEVHGTLPKEWLQDEYNQIDEEGHDIQQIQIVAYYQDQNKNEVGVTLFKKREPELPFKFLARDKVEGRALGRGGVEELFETQIWTNWNEIKVTEMLEAASKTILLSDNPQIAAKHPTGLKNVDNLEIIEATTGTKGLWQMDTYPRNLALFENSIQKWQEHAQQVGSANETLLGDAPPSGTPFKLFEAQQMEAKSMHRFRQGQIATFVEEIYRDWIIKHINREIMNEQHFMAEFSAEEMMKIAQQVAENQKNRMKKERILSGQVFTEEETAQLEEQTKFDFVKGGNKKFIEILKDEFKKAPLAVHANIVGKQKNLALLTDKLVNVIKQYLATPKIRQDPEMIKLLNTILESSGMSPIMFGPSLMQPAMAQGQAAPSAKPLEALAQTNAGTLPGQA